MLRVRSPTRSPSSVCIFENCCTFLKMQDADGNREWGSNALPQKRPDGTRDKHGHERVDPDEYRSSIRGLDHAWELRRRHSAWDEVRSSRQLRLTQSRSWRQDRFDDELKPCRRRRVPPAWWTPSQWNAKLDLEWGPVKAEKKAPAKAPAKALPRRRAAAASSAVAGGKRASERRCGGQSGDDSAMRE